MKVRVSESAQRDLQRACDYLAQDNASAAERLVTRFQEEIERLESGLIQPRRVVLKTGDEVQTWPVYPFRIYYRVEDDVLEVIHFRHMARESIEQE